ncbi:MAG: diacylglycerol kinase family lipid kinase [Bacteroidales bacterium]|jgi:YegS/Rv2252/BmrU family lipid kinase|nr:diacylglycerol kinase family lipid kinase [Bacteroidales bacterium]
MSSENQNIEWFVIVNPNAGRRKGEKDWPEIARLFVEANIRYKSMFTQHRIHAIRMARKYVEMGYQNIIVVGGDGTMNEVVNGIFTQSKRPSNNITVGLIPVGTGNDWCRMFGIPYDYKSAIDVITGGKTFLQDVGWVKFQQEGMEKNRYFVNMAGMGYDALVAEKTNKQKDQGKGGTLSYMLNIFSSLFSFKETMIEISVDGEDVLKAPVFTMNVGICKFNGGGMMQLPNAIPDDGILDMTVIKKLSRFKVVSSVAKLYDGSFTRMPQVKTFKGKSIVINSKPEVYMEADGESLGHSPFKFGIVPKSLKVIIGKEMQVTDTSTDSQP